MSESIETIQQRVDTMTLLVQEVSPSDWVNLNYHTGCWHASTFHTNLKSYHEDPSVALDRLGLLIGNLVHT